MRKFRTRVCHPDQVRQFCDWGWRVLEVTESGVILVRGDDYYDAERTDGGEVEPGSEPGGNARNGEEVLS